MMNKTQATKAYLDRQKGSRTMIKRLMRWNPLKSLKDNAKALGCSPEVARNVAYSYGLVFKKVVNI